MLKALLTRPINFYPALARVTGSIHAAIFLGQLMYWTPKAKDRDGWVYKTQAEWEEETTLTPVEQKTVRKLLVGKGLMNEDLRGVPARLYYQIDMKRLAEALANPETSSPCVGKLRSRGVGGKFATERAAITETTKQRIQAETTQETTETESESTTAHASVGCMDPKLRQILSDKLWSAPWPGDFRRGEGGRSELFRALGDPNRLADITLADAQEVVDYIPGDDPTDYFDHTGEPKLSVAERVEEILEVVRDWNEPRHQ